MKTAAHMGGSGGEIVTEWKDIPGYDGKYQISVDGEVRHIWPSGKVTMLHPFRYGAQGGSRRKSRSGTAYVNLCKNGTARAHKVAHLLAETFLGGIPAGMVAFHKDGIASNDYLRNIGFTTRRELGVLVGGESRRRCVLKINRDGEVVEIFRSAREAARHDHMSYQTVIDRCHGKVKNPFALNGYNYQYDD